MIYLLNLPWSRKKQLSLSPLAWPTSGLTLATGLRVQRAAIGAAITKSDERSGYVASRG
jgi:hypothetical protein